MSTLKTNTIKNTDDVEMYLAKAWVNFNGTGTVAIRAAGNVSSITDRGTGLYGVNFTNALPDANYAVVATNGRGSWMCSVQAQNYPNTTTSIVELRCCDTNSTNQDTADAYVAFVR